MLPREWSGKFCDGSAASEASGFVLKASCKHHGSSSFSFSYASGRRPRGPAPSPWQVQKVAVDAIATLKRAGVDGCFVGGMACKLFGNPRQPNDLDILCLTKDWEQESLKRKLVELNPRFYLVDARSPLATYKVLWYHLLETDSCLKVDLLFPGVLDIPNVPLGSIDRENSVGHPCAPLSAVLLLKLQAWDHHGASSFWRFRLKEPMDERDINSLLPIARRKGLDPRSETFLSKTFLLRAQSRVERYVRKFPHTEGDWKALGFAVVKEKAKRDRKTRREEYVF